MALYITDAFLLYVIGLVRPVAPTVRDAALGVGGDVVLVVVIHHSCHNCPPPH